MSRINLGQILGGGLEMARDGRSRRLLTLVFCLDAPFVFVFLVALQTYFVPQQIGGRAVAGLALALFALGKLALQYQAGRISDLVGPKRGLSLGLTCALGALGILLTAPSEPLLLIPACILYGAGSALAWPAVLSQAHAMPTRMRASLTAAITATSGAGGAAALLLGLLLPESLPFRIAIALALVPVALGLVLSLRPPPAAGRPESDESMRDRSVNLRLIVADRSRVGLGATFFLQSLALAALVASFRALGRDMLGVSLHRETVLLLPVGTCFAIGVVLAGALGWLPRRVLLGTALGLAGASFLVMGHTSGTETQLLLLATGCLGLGLAVPTMTALQLDMARGTPGLLFGFLFALEGLGHILGPAVVTALSDVRLATAVVGGALVAAALASLQVSTISESVLELAGDAG